MKIKIIILFLLFQFVGCQKKTQPTSNHLEKHTEQSSTKINFINYPIDDLEGITSTKYDGIYRSFDFKYINGETMFILSPKIGNEKWYSEQENKYKGKDIDAEIEKNLNQKSFKLLSDEFDVWVFHTPKENMKKTPNMDSPYTPIIPRKISFYKYESSKNNWSIVNTYSIKDEREEAKANQWQESNISKLNISKSDKISSLKEWVGAYINSDDQKLNTYSEIKNRIGWYELKISPNEITYTNDERMESEFPSQSPGGYYINYKCDYVIKGETIELYEKNEGESKLPLKISGNKQKHILTLFKKNNQFYGISQDIINSEKLINSARIKNNSPFLFYRFDLN